MAIVLPVFVVVALCVVYLWHCNRAISVSHPEALRLASKRWTTEDIQKACKKAQDSPPDIRKFLLKKQNRRYVVTGGSGLSGGWIVQHLLMRGEDPKAIRILDLVPNTRPEVVEARVSFHKVDVTDTKAVTAAFDAPWPESVKNLPLTVFHTVAMINPADRKPLFVPPLARVNIEGTRNILKSAQKAGCSCFVACSSGSVGMRVATYFPWPWQRWPDGIYQFADNADPPISLNAKLEDFPIAYVTQAEILVREASTPQCPTGVIRPTNGVYGTGVDNSSSLSWDYMRKRGGPTWLSEVVQPLVNAQNVSIGHLALEKALLDKKPGVADSAYCVTDPNPPIVYADLYKMMMEPAHPLTPPKFPVVPFMPMYLISLLVEQYKIFRHIYMRSLPPLSGDIALLQPGTFKVCTAHMVFPDTRAQKEIDYRGAFGTLEGMALFMVDWNRRVEAQAQRQRAEGREVEVSSFEKDGDMVPKPPVAAAP